MTTQAETNRATIRWGLETGTYGKIVGESGFVAPSFTDLRYVSDALKYNKKIIQSNEIRSDRQVVDQIEVGADSSGDINTELTAQTFDSWFLCLLASDPIGGASGITDTGTTFAVTASAGVTCTVTDSANGFVSAGWVVGQWVRMTGWGTGANNQIAYVASVAAGALGLTLGDATFINESAGPTVSIFGKTVRNGTTKKSLIIEKQFNDLTNIIEYFVGMRVDQLQLNVTSQQIVTANWTLRGKRVVQDTATVGSGPSTAANTNTPFNATANVAKILEGGAVLTTAIKSIQLTIQNNLRNKDVIGDKFPLDQGYGWFVVTGKVEFYYEDAALRAKLINHTTTSLSFRLTDAASKVLIFTIPAIKYSVGDPLVGGPNQDVMLSLDFVALRDSTTGCMFQVDQLN